MKYAVLAAFLCFTSPNSRAAEEPLIPALLDALLPKIHAGMSVADVRDVLAVDFPEAKNEKMYHSGQWEGQTGDINYQLSGRSYLSVGFIYGTHGTVVHDGLFMSFFDSTGKHRVDFRRNFNTGADEEPLLPAALNVMLPKFHGGMTVADAVSLLSSAYPGASVEENPAQKDAGFTYYKFDDRFTLAVSSETRNGKLMVSEDLLFTLVNDVKKRRVEIKSYFWDRASQRHSRFIGQ